MATPSSDVFLGEVKEKTPARIELEQQLKDLENPISLSELGSILGSTIKKDEENKKICFLCMLLNYTKEDQNNIAFNAESSTGKSYIPLELAWYFPKDDILELAYVSPQAFFHEYGEIQPDPKDRNEDETKKHKIVYVNLEQKILVFIDQPHDMLLQRLRPLLSHDRKELVSKITDKRERSGTRTKTVIIRGFTTVLFCTSKFSMDEQERTRLLLLSPETTQDKIRMGILLRIEKESNRASFREFMERDLRRLWLKDRVEAIKTANIENILITEDDRRYIAERFLKERPTLMPRHQRDVSRLLSLIKAHALLNLFSRQRTPDQHSIIATTEDIEEGFNLYQNISEANELGIPPEVHEIYLRIFRDMEEGLTRKDLASKYYAEFHKPLSSKRQDEILRLLNSVGLIREDPDPSDRRRLLVYPQVPGYLSNHGKLNSEDKTSISDMPKLNTPQLGGNSVKSSLLNQVHSCSFLISSIEKGTCGRCQKEGPLTHSVLLFSSKLAPERDLKKILVCSECAQIIESYLGSQGDG
jgi:hypothetical protein